MSGVPNDVFVEASFQKRLNSSSDLVKAEVFHFTQRIEAHGTAAFNSPGYSYSVPTEAAGTPAERLSVWVKVRGTWTLFLIATPQPGVFVLFDR